MPDKKADEKQEEPVTEEIEEEVKEELQEAAPVAEVIEPHPDKPAWVTALENSINGRFDSLDTRLNAVEKGNKEHAEKLDQGGAGPQKSAGGAKETNGGGESKPTGDSQTPPAKRKPGARLWRTI